MNKTIKEFNIHISVFIICFFCFLLLPSVLDTIGFYDLIETYSLFYIRSYTINNYLNIICYTIAFAILICVIQREQFDKLINSFKEHKSIINGIAIGILIVTLTLCYNLIVNNFIKTGANLNEQSVDSLVYREPVLSFFVIVIIAPIFEEYVYRFGLFGFFKDINPKLAYIITIIVFALIHFNVSDDPNIMLNELLNLPTYLFAALSLSFAYDKYGMSACIVAHIVNNLLAYISSLG